MTSPLSILERSFRPLTMPVMADDNPGVMFGVYLLIDRTDVVYVGCDDNIANRLFWHTRGDMRFDRALWMPLPRRVHVHYRSALVRALSPRHMAQYLEQYRMCDRNHDAEILYGLGLRDDLTTDDIAWQEVA